MFVGRIKLIPEIMFVALHLALVVVFLNKAQSNSCFKIFEKLIVSAQLSEKAFYFS